MHAMELRRTVVGFALILVQAVVAGQGAAPRAAVTIVPHDSWPCGLPGGIPAPESGTLVFQADLKLARVVDVGNTQYGGRQVVVVQDVAVTGPKLTASVMTGALDFALTLTNG